MFHKFSLSLVLCTALVACSSDDNEVIEYPSEQSQIETINPPAENIVGVSDYGTDLNSAAAANADLISLDIDTVYFGTDQSNLSAKGRDTLRQQAEWLLSNNERIIIEGHADERGTREYNLALGDRRANSIKNYLIALGVSANRLSTVSYGKERPAALGSDSASWQENRRGVTVVD